MFCLCRSSEESVEVFVDLLKSVEMFVCLSSEERLRCLCVCADLLKSVEMFVCLIF